MPFGGLHMTYPGCWFHSTAKSCLILCSRPGFFILHYLLEFAQTCVQSSQWCHSTISFFAAPCSSCPQFFPALVSFPVSQLFTSGGQNIRASTLVLPINTQGTFPLGLISLVSLLSKGLSRIFYRNTVQKQQFFGVQSSLLSTSHTHIWLLENKQINKIIALTIQTSVSKVMTLPFSTLGSS